MWLCAERIGNPSLLYYCQPGATCLASSVDIGLRLQPGQVVLLLGGGSSATSPS